MSTEYFTPRGIKIQSGPLGAVRNKVGMKFNRLTGIKFLGRVKSNSGNLRMYWLCRCDCGKELSVHTSALIRGGCKSCGCLASEHGYSRSAMNVTHGHTRRNAFKGQKHSDTWTTWNTMHNRCKQKSIGKKYYYDRGITVCDRWSKFENFLEDMGTRPFKSAQLDRIDNDKGYSPDNCRWVTPTENNRNKPKCRMIEFEGKTQCVTAWSEETGIKVNTLIARIKSGWDIARVLTAPVRPY